MIFPKFSRRIRTKVNKISINTEVNIDEVEQKTLLTIGTTKLHRYFRVTLHFLDFHQKNFGKFHLLLLPLPPLLVGFNFNQIINLLQNYFHDSRYGNFEKFLQKFSIAFIQ